MKILGDNIVFKSNFESLECTKNIFLLYFLGQHFCFPSLKSKVQMIFFQLLQKVLGTYDLISLGVGSCAGTGMYLVSGMVAKTIAGPAVVLSYTIAGFAALLSALCYAELGVRVPHTTGSAYVYTYVTVGEFVAFIIGKTFGPG